MMPAVQQASTSKDMRLCHQAAVAKCILGRWGRGGERVCLSLRARLSLVMRHTPRHTLTCSPGSKGQSCTHVHTWWQRGLQESACSCNAVKLAAESCVSAAPPQRCSRWFCNRAESLGSALNACAQQVTPAPRWKVACGNINKYRLKVTSINGPPS